MVFFFGVNNHIFSSELNIPRFQNRKNSNLSYNLYEAYIKDNEWKLRCLNECELNNDFYRIKKDRINNNNFFFLAKAKDLKKFNKKKIINLNNYTDTEPEFRANFRIYIKDGGFSSFQSEYPFEMSKKTGSILTPISPFINETQNNILAFKQIYYLPIKKPFFIYIVDLYSQKVLLKKQFYTNSTNILDLSNINQLKNCCFYSENQLGIPIFVSHGKKLGISMEHSHPPQLYLLSKNRYKIISNLKARVKKIVTKSS